MRACLRFIAAGIDGRLIFLISLVRADGASLREFNKGSRRQSCSEAGAVLTLSVSLSLSLAFSLLALSQPIRVSIFFQGILEAFRIYFPCR